MKQSRQPRSTPVNLSDPIHRQLNAYALASTAAGVGILALSQPAEAKIIYTPAHHVIEKFQKYRLDLNHDGTTDFRLVTFGWQGGHSQADTLSAQPVKGNAVFGDYKVSSRTSSGRSFVSTFASALPAGKKVGPGGTFVGTKMVAVGSLSSNHRNFSNGPWRNVKNRYLGLKFGIKGKVHFGWARLSVSLGNRCCITATLTGYAYETVANKAILTGKTKGPDVVTVRPASLGHLARGASAVSAWRVKPISSAAH